MIRLLTLGLFLSACPLLEAQSIAIDKKEFNSLQVAINKAKPGDIIQIRGIHVGSVKMNKKGITLKGENPDKDGITGNQGSVISADGAYGAESLTIENLTISNGSALGAPGGGIMLKRVKGKSTLNNLIIQRNRTDKVGGGIMIVASRVTVENCWIHENFANRSGGGIALQSGNASDSDIVIRNTVISSNISENHGGAIYVNGNPKWGDKKQLFLAMENSILAYNSTSKKGGAMFIRSAKHLNKNIANVKVNVNHITVAYNRTIHEKEGLPGIAIFGDQGYEPEFALSNSMVVSNGGPKEPDLNFVKSKVMQNEANIFGKVTGMKVSNVDMTHSRVVSDITQIGLSDKLTKVSGKLPVLKLMSGSVAIDNADTNSSLKEDINGNPRSKADIGAVEVN